MDIMDYLVRFLTAIAVVAVLWGIVKYFFNSNPEKRKDGNKFIVYGLLSLLVIVSLWSFVNLVGSVFGIRILKGNSGDFNQPIGEYDESNRLNPFAAPAEDNGIIDDTSYIDLLESQRTSGESDAAQDLFNIDLGGGSE